MTADKPSNFVPRLRFPEFADHGGWDAGPLDAYCQRLTETVGDSHLTPVSITAGKGFVSQSEKFGRDISGTQYSKYIRIRRGDFAYNRGNSKRFPQGCVYQLTEFDEAAASNAFYCFRLKDHCEPGFFRGLFESNVHGRQLVKDITSTARGTGLLNISADAFFRITIPMPKSAAEQQKIADCLGTLDDLIAAEDRKLAALRQHKQGLMQQLFPLPGQTVPRFRFPDFAGSEPWRRQKLGDMAAFLNGRAYQKEELLDSGKYPVLRVGNLFTSDQWFFSDLELDNDKYCDDGDLLYAWSASFGPRIWRGDRVIYHYHIWKVVERASVHRRFLYACLERETERMRSESANGLGMMHLTKAGIEAWECAIPEELDEQIIIARCLETVDDQIAAQAEKIKSLQVHKLGVLQQLFPSLEV